MDKLIFENMTVESVKQRIFDGDTYSFETVQRAVQTICKCPTITILYRDWQALSQFTEEFIQSGQVLKLSNHDNFILVYSNVFFGSRPKLDVDFKHPRSNSTH